jgi:hypothetical protein
LWNNAVVPRQIGETFKVRFRRILKLLSLSLLALALVLAIVAAWLVRRAWPKTEGRLSLRASRPP